MMIAVQNIEQNGKKKGKKYQRLERGLGGAINTRKRKLVKVRAKTRHKDISTNMKEKIHNLKNMCLCHLGCD